MNPADPNCAEYQRSLEQKVIELITTNQRLESIAMVDPLTNTPNSRAITTALNLELERSQRFGRTFAVLLIDLDDFAQFNNIHGHHSGDKALGSFEAIIGDCLRGIDILGTWIGNQFVVIIPEVDRDSALLSAESIRATLATKAMPLDGVKAVFLTCTIGVAMFPEDGITRTELVQAADHAMQAAKRLGRDQVRSANDPTILSVEPDFEINHIEYIQQEVEALAMQVSERDSYSEEQSNAVSDMAEEIALAMGMTEAEAHVVGLVGQLHDIGKITVPDAILQKPAPLDEEEWKVMRQHPVVGADVVSRMSTLRMIGPAIRAHHERWDGKGYPDGLAGEDIPLSARIVAVADAFGAMTSDRPYRKARAIDWALEELHRHAGSQFDPKVVDATEQIVRDLMQQQQQAA
jgi:two-component system cell cycle response regulator